MSQATTTPAALRAAVAARVGGMTGWTESPHVFDTFGREPSSIAHLAFAVGLPRSNFEGGRQRADEGILTRSEVVVRFTARVKPKDGPGSVDAGLDAELALVQRLIVESADWPQTFRLLFTDATRTADATGEWLRHDVTFSALHLVPLQ